MPKTILIVEDNEMNRRLLSDILKFHGYEIIEAINGEKGIEMARMEKPDLILMDLQMPVMNGLNACRILKEAPATRHIKIIAVTSFAMTGDREKILQAGFDEYISKPIETRKLPEIINRLLEERG